MAAIPKMTLEQLQAGLAKTPERTNYQTVAGRALSGIDPRYLGGFDPLQYQNTFNSLYDNLSNEITSQDMNLANMYADYEKGFGRLGDDEIQAGQKLTDAMANRGMLHSGGMLTQSTDLAGEYNRAREDLGSQLKSGFTDAAGRRLQAIGGYNSGLAQQELGLGQTAKGWAQGMINEEANVKRAEEYQRQQAEANAAQAAASQAAMDRWMGMQADSQRQYQNDYAAMMAQQASDMEAMRMATQPQPQEQWQQPPPQQPYVPSWTPQSITQKFTGFMGGGSKPPSDAGKSYIPSYAAGGTPTLNTGSPISAGYGLNTLGSRGQRRRGENVAV